MKETEYGIYGTALKHQLFGERVIYHDEPGIGYVKPGNKLISFISKRDLDKLMDDGPYRYIKDEDEKELD